MKLVCFGDSNTYGYDPRSFFGGRYGPQCRWPELLAQSLGCQVVNAGENGREIPRREGELLRVEQLLAAEHPDVFLVMLGVNDLLQGAAVEVISDRMERFLTRLLHHQTKPILVAQPPVQLGAWVGTPELVDASRQLARAYVALASRLDIPAVDAQTWQIAMTFDGVHFAPEGHAAFAQALSAWFAAQEEKQK